MRSFYILSFCICLGLFASCKHETPAQQENTASVTAADTTPATNPTSTPGENTSEPTKLSEPAPNPTSGTKVDVHMGHDYTFLTHQMFKIKGAYVSGKDPKEKPYADQWLDLEPNGTFKWGKGKEVLYEGNWGYNHDVTTLDLIPNSTKYKQSEWNVQHNDDMVILVGTSTFKNNGTQLQLIRTPQAY